MKNANISNGTQSAMNRLRGQKRRISRHVPYGFVLSSDGRTLVGDKDENHVRSIMRCLREYGWSYRRIANHFNKTKCKAKNGGRWYASTVRSTLLVVDKMYAAAKDRGETHQQVKRSAIRAPY